MDQAGNEAGRLLFTQQGELELALLAPVAQAVMNGVVSVASQSGAGFLGTSHFLISLMLNSPRLQIALIARTAPGDAPDALAARLLRDARTGRRAAEPLPLLCDHFSPHLLKILEAAHQAAADSQTVIDDSHLMLAYAGNPEANSLLILEKSRLTLEDLVEIAAQPAPAGINPPQAPSGQIDMNPDPFSESTGSQGLFLADGSLNLARFEPSGAQVIELAAVEAQRSGQLALNTAHLFIALTYMENGPTAKGLSTQGVSGSKLRKALRMVMNRMQPLSAPPVLNKKSISPRVISILQAAVQYQSKRSKTGLIDEQAILAGFLVTPGSSTAQALVAMGLQMAPLYTAVGLDAGEYMEQVHSEAGGEAASAKKPESVLDKLGNDLTKAAAEGTLPPIIGRREEIQRLIQTLSRQKKNNAVLIGEAGVGKTAIVEGLAQRIAAGKVPPQLKDRRIIEIPISSLTAGTQYRGQFEERLEAIVVEARQTGVILFFDEIHTLVGAGQASGGMLDAANILKPALARGDLHLIGATTPEEYARSIEKDAALERRFQPLYVPELSATATLEVLKSLKPNYESYYQVAIHDDALQAAVQLSEQHLPNRRQPDKAIDLLEETCVRVSTRPYRGSSITSISETPTAADVRLYEVAEVLSSWTGVPIGDIAVEAGERLVDLGERLSKIILGQEPAVKTAAQALLIGSAGLRPAHRPLGVLLFIGPSGVGKTALAYAIAREAFGSEDALFRLDMSEFSEQHSVAKLTGAPPGYIGHEQEGLLTGRLRRWPSGVVLFDEIEKGHPTVYDLFLQLFDAGRLTDSQGRTASGENTLFILTSNIRLGGKQKPPIGFIHPDAKEAVVRREELRTLLASHFRLEFLNRLDDIVLFNSLDIEVARKITHLKLGELQSRAQARGFFLEFDPASLELITSLGFSPEFGARNLQRTIDQLVNQPLSEMIVRRAKGKFLCTVEDGRLAILPAESAAEAEPAGDNLTL